MAKRKWKPGLGSDHLKKKDAEKGEYSKAPSDYVSYVKRGVIKMFVPKEGKNKVRIVQPLEIEELGFYGMEVHFHRAVGDEGEDLFGDYLCNFMMKSILRTCYNDIDVPNKCYIDQQRTGELWDENPDLAKTFYPTRRMWFFVQNLNADNPNEVLLWSCPWTLHIEILSRSSNEETTVYTDVSDPISGVPITFERTGKGKQTKYINVQVFTTALPLDDKCIDQMIEFRDALIIPDYELVKSAFNNESADATPGRGQDVEDKPDPTTDGPAVDEPPEEPAEEGPPECFQKEFDKYAECEAECEFRVECEKGPEEEKPSRPSRPSRKAVKAETTKAPEKAESSAKASIRDKIAAAKKNRENK